MNGAISRLLIRLYGVVLSLTQGESLPFSCIQVSFSKYLPWKGCTSYNAPPTSLKRSADPWSLRNFLPRSSIFIVGKAQKSHGMRSELNSVFSSEKVDRWNPIRTFATQSRSRSMRFLGFSNHEKGAPRQEVSKRSTVCSMFPRSGWSVVRSASLTKEGTSKKRPSPHLHKFPTRSNKVSPWTLQMALVL
jgi:hypothetical protein